MADGYCRLRFLPVTFLSSFLVALEDLSLDFLLAAVSPSASTTGDATAVDDDLLLELLELADLDFDEELGDVSLDAAVVLGMAVVAVGNVDVEAPLPVVAVVAVEVLDEADVDAVVAAAVEVADDVEVQDADFLLDVEALDSLAEAAISLPADSESAKYSGLWTWMPYSPRLSATSSIVRTSLRSACAIQHHRRQYSTRCLACALCLSVCLFVCLSYRMLFGWYWWWPIPWPSFPLGWTAVGSCSAVAHRWPLPR
jgi:hypothetical protein